MERTSSSEEHWEAVTDWSAVMRDLVYGRPELQKSAFLKLQGPRGLLGHFLSTLRARDHLEHWEDLQQIVLMKLIKSFVRGQLPEIKDFRAFAYTVTRNEFYYFLRTRKGIVAAELPDLPAAEPLTKETRLALRDAVQTLPDHERGVVQAVYLEGLTYEEAATATAIPLGSLKRYLRNGLAKLRDALADKF